MTLNNGELVPGDKQKVKEFSEVFNVKDRYVEQYLTYVMNLTRTKEIREKQRRKEKEFNACDWEFLASSTNETRKLLVFELDKYTEHFKLSNHGKTMDKIKRVMAHHLEKASIIKMAKMQLTDQLSKKTVISSDSENDTSENENSDMDDEILGVIGSGENESDKETIDHKTLPDIMTCDRSCYGRKRKQKDFGGDWFMI